LELTGDDTGVSKRVGLIERKSEAYRGHARFQQHRDAFVIKFFFCFFPPLQGKAPKEIHAVLTETLACFLSGRAKDLSASL